MIKVFYNTKQNVPDEIELASPSPSKPQKVIKRFKKVFSDQIEIVDDFIPFSPEIISRVHDPSHVMNILNGIKKNGFGTTHKEIAESLKWTNASFYNAARCALIEKSCTMSPTSGFHHAGFETSEGFCTFNALALAAVLLQEEFDFTGNSVGIVDYDAHYGNGTENIKEKLKLDFIVHDTFGKYADNFGKNKTEIFGTTFFTSDEWLETIPTRIKNAFTNCKIIFYQAGADPHISDPYGGYLTTKQLRLRDRLVFKTVKELQIPIVWNLAGGYQNPLSKVLDIHENTMHEALRYF